MIEIASIAEGSDAERAGLRAGDRLLRLNGEEVRDALDLELWKHAEKLEVEALRGGKLRRARVTRRAGRSLGIEVGAMRMRRCRNRCVFCFVSQMPPGLRPSMSIKDEDYRYSFLAGNFTTLSNMGEADFRRVEEQQLSPLYLSVHTTDPDRRRRLLGNPRLPPILPQLERLRRAGIAFHTQIVLVPGWNDGAEMERTVRELTALHPATLSIGVVPVGLTAFRQGLPRLRPFTAADARACLRRLAPLMQDCSRLVGRNFIYPSDELYIRSGAEFPPPEFYGDYCQYENGIGMTVSFLDSLREELPSLPAAKPGEAVTVLTGKLAGGGMQRALAILGKEKGLRAELVICENHTFGKGVTVTGLLGGKDFLRAARRSRLRGPVLVPPNSLNAGGRFIDDLGLVEFESGCGRRVVAPKSFGDFFP